MAQPLHAEATKLLRESMVDIVLSESQPMAERG